MVSLRQELEARFKRELPIDRDIIIMDSRNGTLTALPRTYDIHTLLKYIKTDEPIILDLARNRVLVAEELSVAEFLSRLEVKDSTTN